MAETTRTEENALLLTAQQVADMLAVSSRTVWRMVKAGKLPPPVRYSRKLVRWRRAEVVRSVKKMQSP